jgi:hypothetical protein
VDSYKYYYFCTNLEQGQCVNDTLFRSSIHTHDEFQISISDGQQQGNGENNKSVIE